ncbi:hypothetical protein ACQKTA_04090 [Enterococcus sp. 22-H-5-01]|uniref:hypothetical protein n=1 Tax=Enterococcus sp. 22-H-5-01 TaxID=3418555 RepID=UPI003D0806D5
MIVMIIFTLFLLIYWLGLSYLATVAFKKKNIDLSFIMKLYIPLYIGKTSISSIKEQWHNKVNRKKAVIGFLLGYELALVILVEVFLFGLEKGLIPKREKKTLRAQINFFKSSTMKSSFSRNIESQLNYA